MAYADVFGEGLTEDELRQRLFGSWPAHGADIKERLAGMGAVVEAVGGRVRLKRNPTPRSGISVVSVDQVKAWAWEAGELPFVRYLALTGTLGAGSGGVEVLAVAARGRAYLAGAFLASLGASAARQAGFTLGAPHVVDEARLVLEPHDVLTATEFVTQVPLYDEGSRLDALWEANHPWLARICATADRPAPPLATGATARKRLGEWAFAGWGGLAEALVRARTRRRVARELGEVAVPPDVVLEPGVFRQRPPERRPETLARYVKRLGELGLDHAWLALE